MVEEKMFQALKKSLQLVQEEMQKDKSTGFCYDKLEMGPDPTRAYF